MTIKEFRLPDPGEGLVEADIVTWHVKVGDEVKINDIVLEVETSKSLVELPSPFEGTVTALLVSEGDTVDVGTPIIAIDDGVPATAGGDDGVPAAAGGSSPAGATAAPAGTPKEDLVPELPAAAPDAEVSADEVKSEGAPDGRVAVLVGYGARTTEAKRRPRKGVASDPGSEQAHAQVAAHSFATDVPVSRRADHRESLPPDQAEPVGGPLPEPGVVERIRPAGGGVVLAKPPVRKLAKDLGVDLDFLAGSGPGGVITRDDVEQAAARAGRSRSPQRKVGPPIRTMGEDASETRIPIKGVRKATAKAMVESAFTAPHVSEWVTCDVIGDDRAGRAAEGPSRLPGRQDHADADHRQGGLPRPATDSGAELLVGRSRPGDRDQALGQPRHRRCHTARAGRAEREGRAGVRSARPGRRPERRDHHGAGGQDPAGGDVRWNVHHHQRRRLRRRRRNSDPEPGRGRDLVRRPDRSATMGRRVR